MASYSSASLRHEAPHATKLSNALRRRAQTVLSDRSIDPQTRVIIRYALEIDDPCLAELVRCADAGESIGETFDFSQTPDANADDSSAAKINTLAELICATSDQSAGALFVLMATIENSAHPKALANAVKHFAFANCAESNLYGIVDSQITVVESELFG